MCDHDSGFKDLLLIFKSGSDYLRSGSVDTVIFCLKGFAIFHPVWIRNASLGRTDTGALGFIEGPYTLRAKIGVYYIDFITFTDRLIGAFRFTCSATYTFIIY